MTVTVRCLWASVEAALGRASAREHGRLIRKVGPQTLLFSGLVAYLKWSPPSSVARGEEPKNDLAVSGL